MQLLDGCFHRTQRFLAMHNQSFGCRERFPFGLAREVLGNRFVIGGGVLKRLAHQLAAGRGLSASFFGDFL